MWVRESMVMAVLACALVHSRAASAADQSPDVAKTMQPIVGGKSLPMTFLPAFPASDSEPAMDFRLRKAKCIDAYSAAEFPLQSRPLQVTSPWQRLADYRSHGGIQLLTLWESPHNMVSLQAGSHGGPSLQWSSRVMNRGGATRGLLDSLVASSLGAAGLDSRMAHASAAAASNKAIINPTPATRYP